MAETQRKLLDFIINLFRPGTKESELITTLQRKMGADEFPNAPSTTRVPHASEQTGTGPSPYIGLESNEVMNIAPPRYNQFQKALLEDEGKLFDPTDKDSVFDPVYGGSIGGEDIKLQTDLVDAQLDSAVNRAKHDPKTLDASRSNIDTKDVIPTKVPESQRGQLDLEGKQFDEGVERVESVLADELTLDPLFPNPQHPRSATSQAIKSEARNTEINAEVQDVIGRFKKKSEEQGLFDIEKLKKAPLNPTPAQKKAAAAGDPEAIAAIEKIKLNSRLWDGWQKLSTNAAGARAGDEKSLAVVRSIDDWLHKTARSPEAANLEGPMREVPANPTMQMIAKDIHTEHLADKKPSTVRDQFGNRGRSDVDELGPTTGPAPEALKGKSPGPIETSPSTVVPGTGHSTIEYPWSQTHQDTESVLLDALKQILKDRK